MTVGVVGVVVVGVDVVGSMTVVVQEPPQAATAISVSRLRSLMPFSSMLPMLTG